jgi:hypothetical protein
MSILYNTEIMEKAAQSIRKKWKKCDFSDIFPILDIFYIKKIYEMDRKNEHQRFFS